MSFKKSIKLVAGRTGQEYNQRKNRNGAWELAGRDRNTARLTLDVGLAVSAFPQAPLRSRTVGFAAFALKRGPSPVLTLAYPPAAFL